MQRLNQFDRRTRQLLDEPVVPTLLMMAIPNALVMFAQQSTGLVEVYFLARLGVDVLAGVSLVFPVLSWIGAVSQGAVGGGVVTAIARALGRGDREHADKLVWCALTVAAALGSLTTALVLWFGPHFYARMGAHGASLSAALTYSHLIFSGAILIWTFNLLLATVRGTGNMMLPLVVVCGGAAVLIPLSPLLIFGCAHAVELSPFFSTTRWEASSLFSTFGEERAFYAPLTCRPAWNGGQFARSSGLEVYRQSSVRRPILR